MSSTSRMTRAPAYIGLWALCQVGVLASGAPHRDLLALIDHAISVVRVGTSRYKKVEAQTRVPWWFIGVLHLMEADCNFTKHLHNGDPVSGRTVHVPKGRPVTGQPPFMWEDSAADACLLEGWTHDNVARLPDGEPDWTLPTVLWRLENWNGWGYFLKGIRDPYLWAGSNLEEKGRFVEDGEFAPERWSDQIGAAVILKAMQARGFILINGAPTV